MASKHQKNDFWKNSCEIKCQVKKEILSFKEYLFYNERGQGYVEYGDKDKDKTKIKKTSTL